MDKEDLELQTSGLSDYLIMACKGICENYKATKPYNSIRYDIGQKRCNMCDIFIEWEGIMCPCCGSKLRTRPRNTRHRIKLMQQIKRI
jgi:uncharacterized paraquat-inducible protein A